MEAFLGALVCLVNCMCASLMSNILPKISSVSIITIERPQVVTLLMKQCRTKMFKVSHELLLNYLYNNNQVEYIS